MKEFRASTTIEAAPETIWTILTDAARYPEWDPGVDRIEGRIALGEKITAHSKLRPGPYRRGRRSTIGAEYRMMRSNPLGNELSKVGLAACKHNLCTTY